MKRTKELVQLSKEHYHALMLCLKINKGLTNGIAIERIKSYADWFYQNHLIPHFKIEERYLFPILGNQHKLIKQALSEHKKIIALFTKAENSEETLKAIATHLETHVRFEERILFEKIQELATAEQLKSIEHMHDGKEFAENSCDVFWE